MITQHINLKQVLFALLIFLVGCGRGGSSGSRGRASAGDAEASGGGAEASAGGAVSGAAGSAVIGPVAYDVYFDNSASMDGYLSGPGTDLKNDVHAFLKDLQTQGIADTIDLGYVNDRLCSYRRNASAAEVNAFIRTLNHDSLVRNGCGRKDSYMDAMLQQVLGANPDHVHVLISDYIFSIGVGNSSELLKQQGDNVETVLSSELRKRDFSTIILKFSSGFDGTYYVESRGGGNGSALPVHGIRRPYYMMIFGSALRMRRLMDFYKSSRFRSFSRFEQVAYFFEPGGASAGGRSGGGATGGDGLAAGGHGTAARGHGAAAKLIRKDRVGEFEIVQPATQLVIDKAVADSVEFQFSVAVDLDELKLDDKYLTNPENYDLPANYRIAAIRRNDDPEDEALRGYSHVFLIRTSDLKPVQDVYLRLKTMIPSWVYSGSTVDDRDPTDSLQQRQTFGFRYLVEGIARGYADRYRNTNLFSLNIQVSQGTATAGGSVSRGDAAGGVAGRDAAGGAEGSGGAGGSGGHGGLIWLVVVCAAIIGLVVWIKNKR
ncbi:MAG TPA: hypothetical protein VG605_11890 [Puia sp.]|nr:hypothetical protein [Puia sp.]